MESDGKQTLCGEALARILVLQSIVAEMPDEASILGFVCRGLEDMPGVAAVCHSRAAPATGEGDVQEFPLGVRDRAYGALVVRLADAAEFAPYAPFVHNICFVVAMLLEQRRLRRLDEEHYRQLEERVRQRTRELAEQVRERQVAEREARTGRERLQVTLRSIGDGVITTDIDGRVVSINGTVEALTGWSAAEAVDRPLTEVFRIVDERTGAACDNPVEQVLRSGQIVELADHTMLLSRAGDRHAIADSAAPICDRQGRIIGVVLIFRDMTEKNRFQEQARRADKLNAVGALAGGIAHDFNNLVGGIFNYLEIARRECADHTPAATALDAALAIHERARALTAQLLTFAKGSAPIRQVQSLARVLEESAAFAFAGSQEACEYRVAKNLWPCDIDRNQIGQVLNNLLINARQAMAEVGVVTLEAENVRVADDHPPLPVGRYVRVRVSDTCGGIDPDLRGRIFDPFFSTKKTGVGLGLATCYSIAEQHGGLIEVDSPPAGGAVFSVFLPAAPTGTAAAAADKPSSASYADTAKVLVMDDQSYIRRPVSIMLEQMGCTAVGAADGDEAVARCREAQETGAPFDFLLLDLTIPGGRGGKEVVRDLRSCCPTAAIIASSGYCEDPVMSRPQAFGFDGSLPKPYSRAELKQLLHRLLGEDRGGR